MPSSTNQAADSTSRIGALEAVLHLPRTFKVASATLQDQRVGLLPKVMFIGSIALLIIVLLAPELGLDGVLAATGVGAIFDAIGLPIEGGFDWLAIAVAAVNLMKLFPTEIVNEHLASAKTKSKPTGPIVDSDPNR